MILLTLSDRWHTPCRAFFSYFLPEHKKASGPVTQASIVALEAQHTSGPKIISTLNGMFGIIKYGLDSCWDGFGTQERERGSQRCAHSELGRFGESSGQLMYTPSSTSVEGITDELATLNDSGKIERRE
jgi:hypothetical protein